MSLMSFMHQTSPFDLPRSRPSGMTLKRSWRDESLDVVLLWSLMSCDWPTIFESCIFGALDVISGKDLLYGVEQCLNVDGVWWSSRKATPNSFRIRGQQFATTNSLTHTLPVLITHNRIPPIFSTTKTHTSKCVFQPFSFLAPQLVPWPKPLYVSPFL